MTTKTGNARELGGDRTGAGEGGKPAAVPVLFPGIALSTRTDDYAPMKQKQAEKFDGVNWKRLDDTPSAFAS
jgi:hypothetical protein